MIGDKPYYQIKTNCGNITDMASNFGTQVWINLTFDGNFTINQDSLKIGFYPSGLAEEFKFRKGVGDNESIVEDAIINTGQEKESYVIHFFVRGEKGFILDNTVINILPSNFITCNNKPLINDTIKIKLGTK